MNAEQLLTHYERISEAPDAVMRLRGFVLDIAVRGKLVPQSDNEESAEALLQRIASEKTRRVNAGEARQPKNLPSPDEPPCALPQSWRWSSIAEIGFISPRVEANDDTQASFVPMPMIAAELGVAHQHEPRKWGEIKKGYTHFAEGDVGLAKITPCFENGKSTVFRKLASGIGSGTTELHVVRPVLVSPDYVLLFFKSSHFIETGIPRMTGTAGQKRVPAEYFAHSPFPLPPLAEQHRIVAKVDELMALCDRLEAARAQREATRHRLTAATLARLNTPEPATSPDGDTPKTSSFQSDARFTLNALPALTARPDQVKQFRQTILNLAVRGKLVAQQASDSSSLELLGCISAEKARLAKAGAIPKPKEIVRDPRWQPDFLPASWSTAALGDVCSVITSGSRGWAEFYSEAGPAFIRAQNIRFGQLKLDGLARVNPPTGSEGSRTQVAKGDLLIVITGAGVTHPGLLETDIGEAYVSQHVALVRPVRTEHSAWLLLCLMAEQGGRAELIERAYGAGKPGLNLDNLRSLTISLPPSTEQHRIVAKVDELMSLCDQLEASLTRGENTRSRLLDALLHKALRPQHDNVIDLAEARKRMQTQRESVACRIVERLAPRRGFGRVRAVKALYLAEAHCAARLGGTWGRGPFGPFDQWIYSLESRAASQDWFSVTEKATAQGGTKTEYKPGAKLQARARAAAEALGTGAAEFERILALLADLNTDESEMVATLYAAWNDLLLEGKPVSDEIVIREFREHWGVSRKAEFTPARLQQWLNWMGKNQLIPRGKGPSTRHQAELL